MTIPETTSNVDLHYCTLIVQFLCTAFLSYLQIHIGSIDPFFLDTPQRKMILLESQRVPEDFAINAELVELTCLAEMIQQMVLAFSSEATSREVRLEKGISRYDVLANSQNAVIFRAFCAHSHAFFILPELAKPSCPSLECSSPVGTLTLLHYCPRRLF